MAELLVCEKSGVWAGAVRREWPALASTVIEARTLEHCAKLLAERPLAVVFLELRADNAGQLAGWLMDGARRYSPARCLVVTTPEWSLLEGDLRDCGALDFVTTPRDLRRATGLLNG